MRVHLQLSGPGWPSHQTGARSGLTHPLTRLSGFLIQANVPPLRSPSQLMLNASIDEQAGRAEAERRHLKVTGTLGVLAEAHRNNLLDFETALEQLRNTNFYLSATLVDTVRHRLSLGERKI